MKGRVLLQSGIRNLRRAPLRSALTMLGIVVGISAIIATSSIGAGAKRKIQQTLSTPQARTINISAASRRSSLNNGSPGRSDRLNPEDYYSIRRSVDGIAAASPRIYVPSGTLKANAKAADVTVEGIDVDGFATIPLHMLAGGPFVHRDIDRRASVCVLSKSLVKAMALTDAAVGRQVSLDKMTCTVVGVVDDMGNSYLSPGAPRDLHVYLPFTSVLRRLSPTALMSIGVQARDLEHVPYIQRRISNVLDENRGARKIDFLVSSNFDLIKSYSDSSIAIVRLLAAVGAISLIVGGIGIMNIMIVSVTERRREIGIRLALGTRPRSILLQFLIEAATLGLVGGAVGIGLGVVASLVVTHVNEWPIEITPESVFGALSAGLGVGLLFGYQPAHLASRLKPVESLHSDA